ncbi:MAG: damage-control phosphatase ARMT1 family protein [Spirochaetia bacterium]
MKTNIDCIPCFFRQAIESSRLCGLSEEQQRVVVNSVAEVLPEFSLTETPIIMSKEIHLRLKDLIGVEDPYYTVKRMSNRKALELYPSLIRRVAEADEPILSAVKLSIAGNLIDYGARQGLDLDTDLAAILRKEEDALAHENPRLFQFASWKNELDELEKLSRKSAGRARLLVLGDNAGEIVFDRILLETIHRIYPGIEIIYAVRGKPIINDVMIEDAREVGIDQTARIVSSGSDAPGTLLELCSPEFVELFYEAEMVMSKGQGNYEAISEENRRIWMLLTAKCPVMAGEFDAQVGDIILTCTEC